MKTVMMVLIALIAVLVMCQEANSDEELAKQFGPFFYQDVDIGKANGVNDYFAVVKFDGNDKGDDNWDNLADFEHKGLPAYVYYSVVKTREYSFILYTTFHPRDWDDEDWTNQRYVFNLGAPQHENDLEAALVIIKNSTNQIQALCTMAHNHWFNYPVDPRVTVKPGFTDDRQGDDGPHFIDTHVKLFVQAEGHGIYGCPVSWNNIQRFDPSTDYAPFGIKRWDIVDFPNGTGIIYFPSPVAQLAQPMRPDDSSNWFQSVGYELISLEELWNLRNERTLFTKDGRFVGTNDGYDDPDPYRNNPKNDNLASAPWAWQDKDAPVGEVFFDPANFASQRFNIPNLNKDYTLDNPPWIKSALARSLTLEVPSGYFLNSNTVVVDKYAAPTFKLSWDNTLVPNQSEIKVEGVQFLWNGESPYYPDHSKYSASSIIYNPDARQGSATLNHYLRQDGFLIARLQLADYEIREYVYVYTDTFWVKLEPHKTGIHVSQKHGSDQTGNGTKAKPLATLKRALEKASYYYKAPKSGRPSRIDTVYLSSGDYRISPILDFPVAIIGSGPQNCAIGSPERAIRLLDNESRRSSLLQGLNITTQIWAREARVKIIECRFTNANWTSSWVMPLKFCNQWAISIQECSNYFELEHNTFDVDQAIFLFKSSPKIYSNLFTRICESAIWIYNCESNPKIGGSKSRANAFINSTVYSNCMSVRYARYNWWGTRNEAVIALNLDDNIDYNYHLTAYPKTVGAPNPSDFDGDGQIGLDDFTIFVPQYGTKKEDAGWDSRFDLNNDGHVGLDDFLALVQLFSQ